MTHTSEDVARITEGLKHRPAQKALLCARLWHPISNPGMPFDKPSLACSTAYSPSVQTALVEAGLVRRKLNGDGTAWLCPTPTGLAVRDHLMKGNSNG